MTHTPSFLSYEQGIEAVASRIVAGEQNLPLVVIDGFYKVGKTHFAREIFGKVWHTIYKLGELVEWNCMGQARVGDIPHFYLIETHQILPLLVVKETQKYFQKSPDLWVHLVPDFNQLATTQQLRLEMLLRQYDFIVENPAAVKR
ncbi:MAG TPA: hypothetical protein VJA18_03285 [Candidatus Nanoarchaeia archaeon]|nr:hypothetical protein [Candidatus Nanoarchaeia archaeon]